MAYLILFFSTFVMPFNSIIRKQYQKEQGIGMRSDLWFVGFSAVASLLTLAVSPARPVLSWPVLLLGFVFAFCADVTAVLCVVGPKFGNLSVLIMYALLGSLVLPVLYSFLVEHQSLSLFQSIGLLTALAILGLDFFDNLKGGARSGKRFKLFCVIVFLANGSLLIIYKLINRYFSECPLNGFLTLWMLESAVFSLLAWLLWPKKTDGTSAGRLSRWLLPAAYGVLVAIGELLSAYCVPRVPTVVQSSVMFCFSLILTAVFDRVVYRQIPSVKGFIQLGLAMAGCILFLL